MIKTFTTLTTTTALTLALGTAAFAQSNSGPNVAAGGESVGGVVSQLAMAHDLYAYSVENKDPLAALTAAKITSAIEAEVVERDYITREVENAAPETGEGKDAPADAAMMYASAKEYAGGNKAMLGLIDDAMAEGARGRIGGASQTLSRLRAGHTDHFTASFYGGRHAELAILGDGDANLDVWVTDEHGNTICVDTSWSDQVYCSWTPRWDGWFNIVVENRGHIRNSYYIITN